MLAALGKHVLAVRCDLQLPKPDFGERCESFCRIPRVDQQKTCLPKAASMAPKTSLYFLDNFVK
ncbi:MAG: hypothetical protein SH850_09665 [Planctomycetaceae bacterium]|nr:hypothetical protein [Planctomycetaceae bacterium]